MSSVPDPLDVIRQHEANEQQRLATARSEATARIEAARRQAQQLVAEARRKGREDGARALAAALQQVDLEAQAWLDAAQERVSRLAQPNREALRAAVDYAVAIIIGETP